jgi:hypothetical protein
MMRGAAMRRVTALATVLLPLATAPPIAITSEGRPALASAACTYACGAGSRVSGLPEDAASKARRQATSRS